MALSACGGEESNPSTTLTIARVKDAVGLDPAHETDGLSLNITAKVLQNLVKFKPGTFDVVPDIAESWSQSLDGTEWTFKLKPNLKFSDGTPVDAAAVKFNFDRWRLKNDPAHGPYSYGYYLSQFGGSYPGLIIGVGAVDPTTLRIKLAAPQGPFLRNVALPAFGIGSPAAIKKDPVAYAQSPIGSGPYVVTEWVKDDHITLDANLLYAGLKPSFPHVIIRDIPDQATSILSIQKGDVDGLTDLRPDDAKTLTDQPSIKIYRQPANNVAYLAMNVEVKPFDDVRVRRAVAYALDLRGIVNGLYAKGSVIGDNFTPPGMLGENPAVKAYPRDIARARALLREAGYPDGFSTLLYYGTAPRPYLPEPQRVAEAIQADLRQAGILVTLQPFEWGVFLQKIRNGEHPMCLIGWTGDNGDPDNFLYTLLDKDSAVKGSAQNYSFWRDPAFDRLVIAGQRTADDAKRRPLYLQANAMVHDQVPVVTIVHTSVPFAMNARIKGVIPRPDSVLDFDLMRPAGTK